MKDVPQADGNEKGLLSSCMQSPVVLAKVLECTPADHFCNPVHREIFGAFREMQASGVAVDLVTTTQFLEDVGKLKRCGDAAGITEIFTFVPSPANWRDYAKKLLDKWKLRERERIVDAMRAGEISNAEAAESLAKLDSAGEQQKLTIRTAEEILSMTFDDKDNYFGDRLIAAGQGLSVVGPGGLGKTRFMFHMAVAMITGRPFLDMDTHAKGKRWLFIQAENNNRRIHDDLKRMLIGLRLFDDEVKLVQECLFIHTIENDADSFLDVENPESCQRIEALVKEIQPDFVVFDPLNCMTALDLNADRDMRTVTAQISRIVKRGNPDRVPIVIHHSLTGKAGAARAIGFDKASYGRNSKVLYNWCRAQINLAPRDAEDNTLLVMTCGKSNNGRPFPDMGVLYDPQKGVYMADPDYNAEEFQRAVGAVSTTKAITIKPVDVAGLFETTITRPDLCRKVETAFSCSQRKAYSAIHEAVTAKTIKQTTKGKWNVEYVKA